MAIENCSVGLSNGQAPDVSHSNVYGGQPTLDTVNKGLSSKCKGGVDSGLEVCVGSGIGSSGNIVHFDNITKTVSGGVFGEKVTYGEEVFVGSEFDNLRTEATLDIH